MRKEKSRDAARSRRSKENHEFYELAKLLPLPAAITSQLDFLDKASIIRLTISFLKLRQFSVNGHPPWAPDFTTLGSVNPYSSHSLTDYAEHYATRQDVRATTSGPVAKTASSELAAYTPAPSSSSFTAPLDSYCQQPASQPKSAASLFDIHQGTHILQSLDGFAFAIGRDGRFLYISETVSMYLGLSQVEMTGASVFDYTHQHDHQELAAHLGLPYKVQDDDTNQAQQQAELSLDCEPASVHSQYSAASNETMIDDYMVANSHNPRKRLKTGVGQERISHSRGGKRMSTASSMSTLAKRPAVKLETGGLVCPEDELGDPINGQPREQELDYGEPLVRQFCIRMKSTLTKRGCQHFKSSGYRVVHVIAHLRAYQSNDHGHLMDPLDEGAACPSVAAAAHKQNKRRGPKTQAKIGAYPNASDTSSKLGERQSITRVRPKIIGMVAVAIALPPPSINELRLESDTFVLRLGLDLRVTHIEPKITELLHYPVDMLAGCSLYSLVHPGDLEQVQRCHADLLRKGQMMSGYYRLLARDGGYLWIQTCATLICNNILGAGQPTALPNSPISSQLPVAGNLPSHVMASTTNGSNNNNYNSNNQKQLTYMSSSSSSYTDQPPNNGLSVSSKVASPALNGQIGAGKYDAMYQDPDQCVIFVNYMITNVINKDEILDVCQSQNYAPSSVFHAGNTNSNTNTSNHNSVAMNTPSSCSSPCQLSPSRRGHQQQEVTGIKPMAKCVPQSGAKKSASHVTIRRNATDSTAKLDQAIYGYTQTGTSGVGALALDHSGGFARHDPSAWLRHQQRASVSQDNATIDHYTSAAAAASSSTLSPSLYKVAFGLDTNGSGYQSHHTHHGHQTTIYPVTAGYGGGSVSTNVMASPWDSTSAAVAAVAAATSNHLSSGHNSVTSHPGMANPYVNNLEMHHQHHLNNSHSAQNFASSSPVASSMAAAVAAGGHHHGHSAHYHQHEATTGGYYNYYNYYGNKFI